MHLALIIYFLIWMLVAQLGFIHVDVHSLAPDRLHISFLLK